MRIVVNSLTISRIFGAAALLFIHPAFGLGVAFYAVYLYCIASDIADGYIARKAQVTSNFGAIMDSVADLILIGVVLIIFIPLLSAYAWILIGVGLVLLVRITALAIGFAKYRTLSLLHTYLNKGSGLFLAAFPILFGLLDSVFVAFSIVFAAAMIAALEELVITIASKELDRNVPSVFHIRRGAGL